MNWNRPDDPQAPPPRRASQGGRGRRRRSPMRVGPALLEGRSRCRLGLRPAPRCASSKPRRRRGSSPATFEPARRMRSSALPARSTQREHAASTLPCASRDVRVPTRDRKRRSVAPSRRRRLKRPGRSRPYTESNRSVNVWWMVTVSSRTPRIIPTPSTIPAAVSNERSRRARTCRNASEPKLRSMRLRRERPARADRSSGPAASSRRETSPATRPSRRKITRSGDGGGGRIVGDEHDGLALARSAPAGGRALPGWTRVSRLPVGSSASTISGSVSSARAIETRCCSPPDSSAGR